MSSPEAMASQGAPSLLFYFGHITDLTPVTTMVEDAGSLWRVKARKVLDYFITKHPKAASTVSAVLDGLIATVAVSEWLETTLDSAAAKAAAHSQVVRQSSRMPMVAYEAELEGGLPNLM